MEKIKFCPLIKESCIKEQCGWYVEHQEVCAVVLMSEDVRDICELAEDDKSAPSLCPHGYMDWDECPDCRH